MPWTCCETERTDDVATCPDCGTTKSAWTVAGGETRTLRVAPAKRFVCERGAAGPPAAPPLPAAYDAAAWEPTVQAPALPLAEAQRLLGAGAGPSPQDVLRVRQLPGKGPPTEVELSVLFEGKAAGTVRAPARDVPPHDARFLLVYGGEPPPGLRFDGLTLVDVTDGAGPAPRVAVAALKRPRATLDVLPAPGPVLLLLRGRGEAPLRGDAPYANEVFEAATTFAVLHREHARTIALDGAVPAPADVVALDVRPGLAQDRTLTVRVPLRAGKARVVKLPADPSAPVDGRLPPRWLLCVYGRGEPGHDDVLSGSGVTAIDVSDPQPDGTEDVARTLVVEGLGLPPVTVTLEVVRPRVVRFVAFAVPPARPRHLDDPAPVQEVGPSREAVVHLGWTLRLEWTVLGPFDALVLSPSLGPVARGGPRDPGQATVGQLEVDPAVLPPLEGRYALEAARAASPGHTDSVGVLGVTRFRVRCLDEHELLERLRVADGEALPPDAKVHETFPCRTVRWIDARAGTWRSTPAATPGLLALAPLGAPMGSIFGPYANRFFGSVAGTLRPWVAYDWAVVGPPGLQVALELPGLAGGPEEVPPWDLGLLATGARGGTREVKVDLAPAARTMTYLQADLSVWRAGAPRQPDTRVTAAVLRLRLDRPLPMIEQGPAGFTLLDGADPVADLGRVSAWTNLQLRWRLRGDAAGSTLRLTVHVAGTPLPEGIPALTSLWEVALKPAGDLGLEATSLLAAVPAELVGKAQLLLCVELVRPAAPDEEARTGSRWAFSAAGDGGRRTITVEVLTLEVGGAEFPCLALGKDCPVIEAIRLHRAFLQTLEELETYYASIRVKLAAAKFVDGAVESARKGKHAIDEMKLGKALHLADEPGEPAYSLGATQLGRDIRTMELELARLKNLAEIAAKKLVDYISSSAQKFDGKSFQEHLTLPAHTDHTIDDDHVDEALKLYGVADGHTLEREEAKRQVGSQTAHALAMLTECLDATEVGRRYLRGVLMAAAANDGTFVKDYLAIDNVWEWVSKGNAALSGPMSAAAAKLLTNHLGVVSEAVRHITPASLTIAQTARSFQAAYQASVEAATQVKDAAGKLLVEADSIKILVMMSALPSGPFVDPAKVRTVADELLDSWSALDGEGAVWRIRKAMAGEAGKAAARVAESAEAIETIKSMRRTRVGVGGWLSVFVDSVALVLTIRKGTDDKYGGAKVMLGLVKDVTGLLKSVAEVGEAYMTVRQAALTSSSTANLAGVRSVVANTSRLQTFKLLCNTATSMAAAALSAMEAFEGFLDRDTERVAWHSAMACSSLVAIVCPPLGAALSLAVWICMEIFLDPPIVDWLETTPWGVHPTMTIHQTIGSYYTKFYGLAVVPFEDYEPNRDGIEVQSNLLSADARTRILLAMSRKGGVSTPVRIDLGNKAGHGNAVIDWPMLPTAQGVRRFRLRRPWELFDDGAAMRGHLCGLRVEIEVDPDHDGPELTAEADMEVRMPTPPTLLALPGAVWGFKDGLLKPRAGAHVGDPWHLPVDQADQPFTVWVTTRYAHGCEVEVRVEIDGQEGTTYPRVPVKDETPYQMGEVRVPVEVTFPAPPPGDDYEFRLVAWLYHPLNPSIPIAMRQSLEMRAASSATIATPD